MEERICNSYWIIIPTGLCPLGHRAGGEAVGCFAVTPYGSSEWLREDPSGIQGAQRSHLTLRTTNRPKSISLLVPLLTRDDSSSELFQTLLNTTLFPKQHESSSVLFSLFSPNPKSKYNSHPSLNAVEFFSHSLVLIQVVTTLCGHNRIFCLMRKPKGFSRPSPPHCPLCMKFNIK